MAKRLKLEAFRQGISLSELKRRKKLEEIGGIGNDANISSVTQSTASDSAGFVAKMVPVHCEHHTNHTRDSRIATDVVLASATPVFSEKSDNTDCTSDSGFATKAILPACATHVHCDRFQESNNTDPTASDSTRFAAEVVLARGLGRAIFAIGLE